MWKRIKTKLTNQHARLAARYGKTMAGVILAAGVIGTLIPFPGTTLLCASPFVAAGELIRLF